MADFSYPTSKLRRGRVQGKGQISPTITSEGSGICKVETEYRIRKLTPKECWRLMDQKDEDFEKAKYEHNHYFLKGSDDRCSVMYLDATEKQKPNDTETFVLCTTNDTSDMGILRTISELGTRIPSEENKVNASIVIGKLEELERWGCVTDITKCTKFMGMPYLVIRNKGQQVTDIIVQVKMGSTNIERYMKITTELNLDQSKLYTILTLIAQITELKIFTSMSLQANINGYIAITEDYEKNILLQISSLSMEIINERTSNTNLYKQAGNSIVVNVLVAIMGQLFEGKEDIYKEISEKETPYKGVSTIYKESADE